jgi:hypothetical protein
MSHRTMAEVMRADERAEKERQRKKSLSDKKSDC